MKVDSAGFALTHDFPAGKRLVAVELERLGRFYIEKPFGGDERHGQRERLAKQIAVERRIEKHDLERTGRETRGETQTVGFCDFDRARRQALLVGA